MATKLRRMDKELQECTGREIYSDELTQDVLRKYDQWLISAGNQANTSHKKFERFRYFYNCAMQEGRAPGPNPFYI